MSDLSEDNRRALLNVWPWPREAATTRDGFAAVADTVAAMLDQARAEVLEETAAMCAAAKTARSRRQVAAYLDSRARLALARHTGAGQ